MTVEAASGGDLRLELFVEDIERSTAFYCDVLGFTREASSTGYVPVRLGRAVIGIGLMPRLPEGHPIKRCGMSAPGSAWRSCWRWQTSMRRAGARSTREGACTGRCKCGREG
jgi:catechol 2,3-dioxygenase-like lactoylglutathione lyase family enzyme